jgi:hypothetical protein
VTLASTWKSVSTEPSASMTSSLAALRFLAGVPAASRSGGGSW